MDFCIECGADDHTIRKCPYLNHDEAEERQADEEQ